MLSKGGVRVAHRDKKRQSRLPACLRSSSRRGLAGLWVAHFARFVSLPRERPPHPLSFLLLLLPCPGLRAALLVLGRRC